MNLEYISTKYQNNLSYNLFELYEPFEGFLLGR